MNNQSVNYEFENYRLLADERLLLCNGHKVQLKPKVFETLLTLVQHHGKLLTKDRLMQLIWNGNFVEEGNLSQYIFTLRKILGETPYDHRFIVTVPCQGYRFVAPVRETTVDCTQSFKEALRDHIKSLAVLPLRILSAPETSRYLGLAIADTLITRLGNNQTLDVRPTASIIKYTEAEVDLVSLGQELAVEAVMHGTLLEANGKLRVNMQLTDIHTFQTIWANKFEGQTVDLMSFQDHIIEQVANR